MISFSEFSEFYSIIYACSKKIVCLYILCSINKYLINIEKINLMYIFNYCQNLLILHISYFTLLHAKSMMSELHKLYFRKSNAQINTIKLLNIKIFHFCETCGNNIGRRCKRITVIYSCDFIYRILSNRYCMRV